MNILGEGFPDTIIEQVHQRQKKYGAGFTGTQRSAEELIYLNANTSWCKLVSSVDIDDIKNIVNQSLSGLSNMTGNDLAEKFVLFNGVNDNGSGDNQRSGVTNSNNILGNNNAYGIGGNDFGIRPMMGIQSANIKHENRGSIRRATVKIKAFNKVQFDIIDVLYLRLGFSILLEWGHSMYYDNKGELQTNPQNSLADDFLNGKGQTILTPGPVGNIIAGIGMLSDPNFADKAGGKLSFGIGSIVLGVYLLNRASQKKEEQNEKDKWSNGKK